jgi:hypothetical protein
MKTMRLTIFLPVLFKISVLLFTTGLLLFTFTGCKKSCPETTIISTGLFKDNWIYENKELNIQLQLPLDWYMLTFVGKHPYSISMNLQMPPDLNIKPEITLKELIERRDKEKDMPIFGISDKEFPPRDRLIENSYHAKIHLGLGYSFNQDADKDIDLIMKVFNEQTMNVPKAIKEKYQPKKTKIPFGEKEEIAGFEAKSQEVTRITGFKNYGCYNLIISIDYVSMQDFEKIKSILKSINSLNNNIVSKE